MFSDIYILCYAFLGLETESPALLRSLEANRLINLVDGEDAEDSQPSAARSLKRKRESQAIKATKNIKEGLTDFGDKFAKVKQQDAMVKQQETMLNFMRDMLQQNQQFLLTMVDKLTKKEQ